MSGDLQVKGIKGWLLLPAIALIFKVFGTIVFCLGSIFVMTNTEIREYVFSVLYTIHIMSYFNYFIIWAIFISFANCYLAYLFFTKNYKTPRVYIILNSAYFIGFVIYWLIELNFNVYFPYIYSSMKGKILIELISTIIWVLYFCFSIRVKNTFIYE